jgi:hypothetical protein
MRLLHSTTAALAAAALASSAALAAEKLANNEPQAIDGIQTVCDGISLNDRDDPKWGSYSLRLEFAGKGGQYLGGETVSLTGNEIELSVQCQGPWVLMDLPAGSYHVSADVPDAGHKEMNVRVPTSGQAVVVFSFPNAGGEITRPVEQPRIALR